MTERPDHDALKRIDEFRKLQERIFGQAVIKTFFSFGLEKHMPQLSLPLPPEVRSALRDCKGRTIKVGHRHLDGLSLDSARAELEAIRERLIQELRSPEAPHEIAIAYAKAVESAKLSPEQGPRER